MGKVLSKKEVDRISKLCSDYRIKDYIIHNDGSIDVNQDIDLSNLELNDLRDIGLVFNVVNGKFVCAANHLKNLLGAPKEIYGSLLCNGNQMTSLLGCPSVITRVFNCRYNELTSLEHSPSEVYNLMCTDNRLTTLDYCPDIENVLNCSSNRLTSLKGAPKHIPLHFDCSSNLLTTLKFGPDSVGGNFDFGYNELENFNGAPQSIGGSMTFTDCGITERFLIYIRPLNMVDMNIFLKYQSYYDIFDPELNIDNLKDFINDIHEGLL